MKIGSSLLNLSWERSKFDLVKKSFIKPFELELINESAVDWLKHIEGLLSKDNYYPSTAYPIDVPKQNSAIRLGSHLSIIDVLIYTLLISKNLIKIKNCLNWSANKFVYSHVIARNTTEIQWIENPYSAWEKFTKDSITILDEGYNYVLFTDITAYYENINIKHLLSDLSDIGIAKEDIKIITNCLYKWSFNQCDGVPQGYSSSDILANLYLNEIDYGLHESNYRFVRYGDDYRFFCKNITEAKQAQMYLTQMLRSRGLNLQNKKTETLKPILAKMKIDGVMSTIEMVKNNVLNDVVYSSSYGSDYMDSWQEKTEETQSDNTSEDFIKETFNAHFVDENKEFNKTLFKFCLNKLALKKDPFALKTAIKFLYQHPEETGSILKYLNAISIDEDVLCAIECYVSSPEAIYTYQKYQILNWMLENNKSMLSIFLRISKLIAFDANQPFYIKNVCRLIIGEVGTAADLTRIKQLYQDALPDYEKSEIIYSLRKMEKTKRNSFYGQIKTDSYIVNKTLFSSKQF